MKYREFTDAQLGITSRMWGTSRRGLEVTTHAVHVYAGRMTVTVLRDTPVKSDNGQKVVFTKASA